MSAQPLKVMREALMITIFNSGDGKRKGEFNETCG